MISTRLSSVKSVFKSKLAVAGIVAAMTAVAGTAGIAAASPVDNDINRALAANCHHNFQQLGYHSVQQCAHSMPQQAHGGGGQGSGYGGSTTTVTINNNGNGVINVVINVINVIINH